VPPPDLGSALPLPDPVAEYALESEPAAAEIELATGTDADGTTGVEADVRQSDAERPSHP
jgi:hypothetical protein